MTHSVVDFLKAVQIEVSQRDRRCSASHCLPMGGRLFRADTARESRLARGLCDSETWLHVACAHEFICPRRDEFAFQDQPPLVTSLNDGNLQHARLLAHE